MALAKFSEEQALLWLVTGNALYSVGARYTCHVLDVEGFDQSAEGAGNSSGGCLSWHKSQKETR